MFLCTCFMRNLVYLHVLSRSFSQMFMWSFPLTLIDIEITYTHSSQPGRELRVFCRASLGGRTEQEQLWISFILIVSHLLLTHLGFSENFTGTSLFYRTLWTLLLFFIGQVLCSSDLIDIKDLLGLTLDSRGWWRASSPLQCFLWIKTHRQKEALKIFR